MPENRTQNGSGVAWTALVLAVIALIVGWIAFNRSGEDLENVVQQEVDEAVVDIKADLENLESRSRREAADELRETADEVEN